MSEIRDIELEVAYHLNKYIKGQHDLFGIKPTKYILNDVASRFARSYILADHLEAIKIDSKYVVLARYDENQYSSPPNMRIFGIFSDMDKAKDTMAVWAINKGLGNEMLSTCTYDWMMIYGVNV